MVVALLKATLQRNVRSSAAAHENCTAGMPTWQSVMVGEGAAVHCMQGLEASG
jgi:hypothetical protein